MYKKLGALLLVLLVGVGLSACSAFYADDMQTYPADEPFTTTVFLRVKDVANFNAGQLALWQAEMNGKIAVMKLDPNPTPKITDFTLRESTTNPADTYTVDLTLSNVPADTVQKQVRPFKITYTQTTFNPIVLLPASDMFTYVIGYTTTRRHSSANTDWVETQDDGSYVYLWTSGDPVTLTDVYPNRPLYYVIIIAGALVIGTIVYVVNRRRRDNDCKKSQIPL